MAGIDPAISFCGASDADFEEVSDTGGDCHGGGTLRLHAQGGGKLRCRTSLGAKCAKPHERNQRCNDDDGKGPPLGGEHRGDDGKGRGKQKVSSPATCSTVVVEVNRRL